MFFSRLSAKKFFASLRDRKTYCKNRANKKNGVFTQILPFSKIKKSD